MNRLVYVNVLNKNTLAGHGGYPLTLAKTLSPTLNCTVFFIFCYENTLEQVPYETTETFKCFLLKLFSVLLSVTSQNLLDTTWTKIGLTCKFVNSSTNVNITTISF